VPGSGARVVSLGLHQRAVAPSRFARALFLSHLHTLAYLSFCFYTQTYSPASLSGVALAVSPLCMVLHSHPRNLTITHFATCSLAPTPFFSHRLRAACFIFRACCTSSQTAPQSWNCSATLAGRCFQRRGAGQAQSSMQWLHGSGVRAVTAAVVSVSVRWATFADGCG
jgi:hypothetical protein